VNLDQKFVVDIAAMPPKASAYFRHRPFLSPEVCRKWRVGYLPRDAGGDHAGGTMRGKIVYGYQSEDGKLLTWFGRDPEFEERHQKWHSGGKQGQEPEKFHFVKGFHRGIELFGQQTLHSLEATEKLRALGLIVVEGPNDVIRLDTLGVPAVALCSNRISREQAEKAVRLAREHASSVVTILLDCDAEGEEGMKQCLGYVAQFCPVRLAWTSKMYGGEFKGRQPESLGAEEWGEIQRYLVSGEASDRSLEK
jgi:5S rRNA maturation endonuclease (ribonuclease M5)